MRYTILLLHGWISSKEQFTSSANKYRACIAELKKFGYALVMPDLPGFGDAGGISGALTLSDYATFLHEYIKKNSLTDVILIGHSFGGRVALKYNQMYPRTVRALIVSGTPGFSPVPRVKLLLFIGIAKLGGVVFSLPFLRYMKNRVRHWYYRFIGVHDYYRAEGYMRQTFKNVVTEDLTPCMKGVHIPSLLLWGNDDRIVPYSISIKMHALMPKSVLINIPNAGHSVLESNPQECAVHIKRFIEKYEYYSDNSR